MNMDEVVDVAESLRGATLQRYTIEAIERKLKDLVANNYFPSAVQKTDPEIWYRGRSCPSLDGYANLHDCIYRPAEHVGLSRANYPKDPAFYASWNEATVFNELAVEPGQFVHLIASRIRPRSTIIFTPMDGVLFHVIGDLTHFYNTGRSMIGDPALELEYDNRSKNDPHDVKLKHHYFDAFFASKFAERVKDPFEYKLTAALAKLFFRMPRGGILYPSVVTPGAINLAVPAQLFDDYFEVMWTEVVKIDHVYGFGVYDGSCVRSSCVFSDNGDIHWDHPKPRPYKVFYDRGRGLSGAAKGWRVPK